MHYTKSQLDAIAKIKYLANDKRTRVLLKDQCAWLEQKLTEIARLVHKLPGKTWNSKGEHQ